MSDNLNIAVVMSPELKQAMDKSKLCPASRPNQLRKMR